MYISIPVDLGAFGWQDLDVNYKAEKRGRYHDIDITSAKFGSQCVMDLIDIELGDKIRSDIQFRLIESAA